MATILDHPVHKIIQQLLIDLNVGSDPDVSDVWPVFAPTEPDRPDNCITIHRTGGVETGNSSQSGEIFTYHGFQIRVRAADDDLACVKADYIYNFLNESIDAVTVTLDSASYCIDMVVTNGTVMYLGTAQPENRLHLYTVNALADIKRVV